MKRQVFQVAHQIRNFFFSFADALRAAWRIVKMKWGYPVDIAFAKQETGEVREALAIGGGSLDTLPKGYFRFVEITGNGGTQWRSFRLENLIFFKS